MRDKRFVAVHCGGPLSKNHHRLLISWATDCAEHVLPLFEGEDKRLHHALEVARAWVKGETSVGEARKVSVGAIALARESTHLASVAVARAVGHAVATAHMADHSTRAADYALKAIKAVGQSTELQPQWQDDQLPGDIRELILSARSQRGLPIN